MNERSPAVVVAVVVGTILPLFAAAAVFGLSGEPLRLLQECGVFGYAVLLAVLVSGLGAPALCGFTRAPRALWAAAAALPVWVGVLGVVVSAQNVSDAIVSVNLADRIVIAAAGAGEVAGLFALAGVVGGACVVAVGLVVVAADAGPGGGLVVGAGAVAAVLGVRWFLLRAGLAACGMVSPADRMTVLAGTSQEAQVLSLVLGGVAIVAVVAALALGITRKQDLQVGSNVALAVVAVLVGGAVAGGHLALNGVTAMPEPFPAGTDLVSARGGQQTSPPGHLVKPGGVDSLGGDGDVYTLTTTSTGRDLRAALRQALQARPPPPADSPESLLFGRGESTTVWLVGRTKTELPADLAVPAVFEPFFHPVLGVEVEPASASSDRATLVVVLGRVDAAVVAAAGARAVTPAELVNLSELPAEATVAAVYADDVPAQDLIDGLIAASAAVNRGQLDRRRLLLR